jgi:hypothetical protein
MTYSKETLISLMKLNASYLADAKKDDEVVCVFDIIQSLKWKLDDIFEAEQQEKSAPTAATAEADKKENTPKILSANGEELSIGDWVYTRSNNIWRIAKIKGTTVYVKQDDGSNNYYPANEIYKLERCRTFENGHQVLTTKGYGEINSEIDNVKYKIELDNGGMAICEPWEIWERPKW